MSVAEDSVLKERTAERKSYEALTSAMIKTLGILFSVLTLVLFFMLLNEFRRRIRIQAELQQKMIEIGQSKQELEHIAYATSHDLQEPLRKIRILTDKWKHQQKQEALDDDTRDTLSRVAGAATRMQELVGELMTLTTLNAGLPPVACPLLEYVQHAMSVLAAPIKEKDARITIEALPEIQGYPDQLKLLFRSLMDNALKFARPEVPPEIRISMRIARSEELDAELHTDLQYFCILIEDNGIGFDNKMAEKMFGIFRQLHTVQEGYTGKGTGLAICRRIMTNHKGHILAHGFPDAGATFKLYFPA
jgi:light-regulated signal transduction histidine kinase (bacteriophytochrome)